MPHHTAVSGATADIPSKIQTYDENPLALFVAVCTVASCSQYKYESVAGDPLHTRIYTLDNGLKVYMTVNNEEPRIQTYIAVKVDTRNDPEETTRTIRAK